MKNFFQVTALSALLTLLRMLFGIIIVKVVSVTTGPTGLAMLGQIQSFVTSLSGIASAPAGNGVVRFTAQHHSNGFDSCSPWWRASLQYIFLICGLIIPICIFASDQITIWLFNDAKFKWVLITAILVLPITAVGTLFNSIVNGQQNFRRYIALGMLSVLSSGLVMIFTIMEYGLEGALLAAAIQSALIGIVFILGNIKQAWCKLKYFFGKTSTENLKGISGYLLMALISAITMPLSLMIIRAILSKEQGWDATGNWQAVWKISEIYLSIITIGLTTYYLPRLAALSAWADSLHEAKKIANLTIPFVVGVALFIFLFRDLVLKILFSNSFNGSADLFIFQLFGDILKIWGWIYAYILIAKGEVRIFITFEILLSALFVFFSYVFIKFYGTSGVCLAYLLSYSIYSLAVFLFVNKRREKNI